MFFSDDKTIEALQKQLIEQQQTIATMRETIASELMDQSKFLGPLMTGAGTQFVDMFIAFFLALAFTWLSMWFMTKWKFIQRVNVPYHDELEAIVDEYTGDKAKEIDIAKAIFAKALSDNNSVRLIGGLFILASMYAYLS